MQHPCFSSIGNKFWVGITGIGISGFALIHMSGNLLLFCGAEAYNTYSYQLTHNKLFYYSIETGLFALFILHFLIALRLGAANRAARGKKPICAGSGEKRAGFASRTMVYSGLVLLIFICFHLYSFRFGTHYTVTYNNIEMRDMFRLVEEKFADPAYVSFYVFAILVLMLHLSHGIAAVFQTLGITSFRKCSLRCLALGFSALVGLGFIAQPLYFFYLKGGH